MNNIPIIFIVIWFILLFAKLLKLNKVEDYTTIIKLDKFNLFGLKLFYKLKLINIATLLFYIVFGFMELDFVYFILHILIFGISTLKAKTNNINNG